MEQLNVEGQGIALVITFDHPDLVTHAFAAKIAVAFGSVGYELQILTMNATMAQKAQTIDWRRVRLCVLVGALPMTIQFDDKPIYEALKCPFVYYVLDSVFYDLARVPATRAYLEAALDDPRLTFACAERSHQRTLRAYADARGKSVTTFYTPFGAFFRVPSHRPTRTARGLLVGNIGVELAGSALRDDLAATVTELAPPTVDAAKVPRLVEALAAPRLPYELSAVIVRELGLAPTWLVDPSILAYVCAIDSQIKRDRRAALARAVAGLPVDILGRGWDAYLPEDSQARVIGNLSHPELFNVAVGYAWGINIDPNWGDGMHDRVLTYLAAGMRVVTNENAMVATLPEVARGRVRTFDDESVADVLADQARASAEASNEVWSHRDLSCVQGHLWVDRCFEWAQFEP